MKTAGTGDPEELEAAVRDKLFRIMKFLSGDGNAPEKLAGLDAKLEEAMLVIGEGCPAVREGLGRA